MDNPSDTGEGSDQLMELRGPRNQGRRENQRSSEESIVSHQSSSSKDSGYSFGGVKINLKGYLQPSLQEAAQYFHGLLGHPKLIARTSKTPFVRTYENQYPREKRVTNIGNHTLCAIYNQEARESIWNALKSIPWLTIDITRIGFSGKHSVDPIVMLITIKAGSIPWVKAQEAVNACQEIIQQRGCEIEVEMREGVPLKNFAGNEDDGPELLKDPYQRISEIGQSIGIQDEGKMARGAGTLTAYVKILGGALGGRTYGLTCHHVVFPEYSPSPAGKGNTYKRGNGPRQLLCQPATLDHDLRSRNLQYQRVSAKNDLATLLEKEKAAEEGIAKQLTEYQKHEIKRCQTIIADSKNREEANGNFNRTFGFVAVSSGLSINRENNNIRDWALIELHGGRFNERPLNKIPQFEFTEKQRYDLDHCLNGNDQMRLWQVQDTPITETVSLNEVLNSAVTDTAGERSFRVLKHGRTTHWTAGVVNEIKSDCQREQGEISTELCVLNLIKRVEFTRPGDSGALVIDYHGRAVGIAHGGGAPLSEGANYHYVTPIEWLFEDIKNTLMAEKVEFSS